MAEGAWMASFSICLRVRMNLASPITPCRGRAAGVCRHWWQRSVEVLSDYGDDTIVLVFDSGDILVLLLALLLQLLLVLLYKGTPRGRGW